MERNETEQIFNMFKPGAKNNKPEEKEKAENTDLI